MGEFRIGRSRAQHSYPDPRNPGGPIFARNFAAGPASTTPVAATATGTLVPWAAIESGAPAGTNVPITPKTTGVVVISGVICLKNAAATASVALIEVLVDGIVLPLPELEAVTIDPLFGFVAVPILTETFLSIQNTHEVSFRVIASQTNAVSIAMDSSSMHVTEVPVATG